MRNLLRYGLLLIALVAAAVIVSRLRERKAAVPAAGLPQADRGPAGPPAAPAPAEADDLTRVWGIGPVYRARLAAAGINSFAELAAVDPATVIAATQAPPARATDWIAQAAGLIGR